MGPVPYASGMPAPAPAPGPTQPVPVVLDTDIGTDIDDTWAIAMLLASPEIDLRLITTTTGDARYRAGLCARLLAIGKRQDVPIGVGISTELDVAPNMAGTPQAGFITEADLRDHPVVHEDGVDAMINAILASPTPVTLLAIGPLTNIAEALRRNPEIAAKTRLVGMHGSVRVGYAGSETIHAEYNVRADIPAAKTVLAANWIETVITPLDSCGNIVLRNDSYKRFADFAAAHPGSMAEAVLDNYRMWLTATAGTQERADTRSTILFDTVAVYLAYATDLLRMETLSISVDDGGFTRIDPGGTPMQVATGWTDESAFDTLLTDRLCC
jgi:inosine-uridine nucleoside N-ribohydrolase